MVNFDNSIVNNFYLDIGLMQNTLLSLSINNDPGKDKIYTHFINSIIQLLYYHSKVCSNRKDKYDIINYINISTINCIRILDGGETQYIMTFIKIFFRNYHDYFSHLLQESAKPISDKWINFISFIAVYIIIMGMTQDRGLKVSYNGKVYNYDDYYKFIDGITIDYDDMCGVSRSIEINDYINKNYSLLEALTNILLAPPS